ncbi:MAG: SCO family protein [Betaproteobacteria bacterium]
MSVLISRRTALLACAALAACSPDKPDFRSIDITGADYARDFKLVDHNGQERSLADFRGKVVVVFFGFTQCPDVCPTAMAQLVQVKQLLGRDGDKLQALFITLDPERDSAEILKAYTANFDAGFLGLRPSLEQLPELTRHFKIFYKKNEGKTPTSYTLDHSAGSYVFDTQGRVRLYARQNMSAAAIAEDLKILLR